MDLTKRGLAPILDSQTRILILGSFPSEQSLRAKQYYANPRNQFWRLMSDVLDENLLLHGYAQRVLRLRAHGIGLWDAYAQCVREGSLDSHILDAVPNDIAKLKVRAQNVELLLFNGGKAGGHAQEARALGYRAAILPSSSPANAIPYAKKLAAWKHALLLEQ